MMTPKNEVGKRKPTARRSFSMVYKSAHENNNAPRLSCVPWQVKNSDWEKRNSKKNVSSAKSGRWCLRTVYAPSVHDN